MITSVSRTSMEPRYSRPDAERRLAAVGNQNLIAQLSQDSLDESANARLILDQQDRFQANRSRVVWKRRKFFRLSRGERKIDPEPAALARLAFHVDVAARLGNHAVDGGEPEPGPFTLVLGCEKGLEHARLGGVVHADSVVAHLEDDAQRREPGPLQQVVAERRTRSRAARRAAWRPSRSPPGS